MLGRRRGCCRVVVGSLGALLVATVVTGEEGRDANTTRTDPSAAEVVVTRLPEDRDAFFVANHYTGMTLLQLRTNGTFAEYGREHMFTAVVDEGRWMQRPTGELLLCSHYRFEPIRAGSLEVWLAADETAGVPALLAAIEQRLATAPDKRRFRPKDLRPVVVRWSQAEDLYEPVPAGALAPVVESDQKRVAREELEALAVALRHWIADRSGSLTMHALKRYRDLVWLSEGQNVLEEDMLRDYRARVDRPSPDGQADEEPFLPGSVSVGVDGRTFSGLLGTTQPFVHYPEMNLLVPRRTLLSDFRRRRIEAPLCGSFADGAAALPAPPRATVASLAEGEELGLAMAGAFSDVRVQLLTTDGRYARFERSATETAVSDEGEWLRGPDDVLKLCSHVVFRSVGHDRLQLSVDEASYAKLPAFLAALRSVLAADPDRKSFKVKTLERLVSRTLSASRAAGKGCECQRLVQGSEPVTQDELQAFVTELDDYLRSGKANLSEQRLWTTGATTWLADPAGLENATVVRTLRALGEGPCLLAGVFVRIPMTDALGLRGPLPSDGRPVRTLPAPACAGFRAEPSEGSVTR